MGVVEEKDEGREEEDYTMIFDEKEVDEGKAKNMEDKLESVLRVITEDARQLSEYLVEEGHMVRGICTSLKRVFSELDLSIALPEKILPSVKNSKRIFLNPYGHLIVVQKSGRVESRSLEDYPPEVILTVVWGLIPKLREEVSAYMKKVSTRLNLLEIINEELKNIQKPFQPHEEGMTKESDEDFPERKARQVLIPQKK